MSLLAASTTGGVMRPLLLAGSIVYPLLILYGSLFPVGSWRASGIPALAFLSAEMPHYWTVFDLAANFALYLPLGFLWAITLAGPVFGRPIVGALLAVAAASSFSLGVEVLQNWLPSRVPSNLDWLSNTVGALAGVLAAHVLWLRHRLAGAEPGMPDRQADNRRRAIGALLLILWAVGQLSPQGLLFCSGLSETPAAEWLPAVAVAHRVSAEAVAVALHLLVIGLLFRYVAAGSYAYFMAQLLLGALFVITGKAVVSALGLGVGKAFVWLSSAALWGVLAGAVAVALAAALPPRARHLIALSALIVGSMLLLMQSGSPYAPAIEREISASALRNFVGTLNAVGALWPFLLAAYLLGLRRRPKSSGLK